jgi:hypothetical protein
MNCGARHIDELPITCTKCGDTRFLSHLLQEGEVYTDNEAEIVSNQDIPHKRVRRK